jgi:ubiquitin carboxyl-terminal hydrolase 10
MSSHAYPQTGAGPSSYYQHSPPPHHVYGNHSPGPRPNYQYSYPVPPPNLNSYQSPQFQQSPSRGNHSYYQHSPPPHYVYGNHSPGPRPNYQHSHPVPLPNLNLHQSSQFQPMPSTGNHNAGSGGASAPSHESVMSQTPYTSTYSQMGTISTSDTVSPLSPPPSSSHPSPPRQPVVNPVAQWAIWSRRPQDPSHAPGIIISPRARPPPDVVQQAIDLKTPPPSQPSSPSQSVTILPGLEESLVENMIGTTKEEDPQPFAISPPARPPQDVVEQAIVLKTPPPSHPSSPPQSVTILPAVEDPLIEGTIGAAKEEEDATPVDGYDLSTPFVPEPTAAVPPQVPPTPVIVKKWADLLRPSTSSTSSSPTSLSSGSATRNTLPTSSVIGFSIPAGSPSSSNRTMPVSPSKKSELISLLTTGPSPNLTTAGTTTIRPRGIVNSGNMCYANSVLQVLVYCPPFQRLFAELGKVTSGSTSTPINGLNGTEKDAVGMTPLVEATVEFLREFMDEKKPKSKTKKLAHSRKVDGGGEVDWDACDSFLPTYMYDAMKLKKRFDHMRVCSLSFFYPLP